MNRVEVRWIVVLAAIGIFALPAAASAASRIQLGTLKVQRGRVVPEARNQWKATATFSTSARYEDNFFQTAENEHAVRTYLFQPGIQLGYHSAKSVIRLLYTVDAHVYEDRDDGPEGSADGDDFIGHTLALHMRTSPTPKLSFGIDNELDVTREENKSDRFANETGRDRFFVNRFTPGVFYRFNDHFSTAASYRHTLLDYKRDTDQDSTENRGIWEGFYDLSPKTAIGLKYQYWKRNYEMDANDYASNQGELVLNRRGKHLELEAGAGYQNRDFDAEGRSDEDTYNYRIALTGQTAETPLGHPRSYLTAAFEQNFNDSGVSDDFFDAMRFRLTAGHVFMDRFLLELDGHYLNADYPQQSEDRPDGSRVGREDDRYGVTASAGYWFREWVALLLSGGYEQRESNLAGFDFDNTFVQLSLNTNYDFGGR